MTEDEKREYIAIHGMSPERLKELDGKDIGKTFARWLRLTTMAKALDDDEAFALEGSRKWADYEKEMKKIKKAVK